MKTCRTILVMTIMLLCSLANAQEVLREGDNEQKKERKERKVRPVRLGVKVGFPNAIGGNVEYVTPLLEKRLALSVDYSTIKSGWFEVEKQEGNFENPENSEFNLSYWEGGINYYFFKPGRGFYGNLSYGVIRINGTVHTESEDGLNRPGIGNIDFSNRSFNIKVGQKLGGLFYLRSEVGYSFTPPPRSIEYQVRYTDGSTETKMETFEENPYADPFFKGLIVNIGIGFAFGN